jgi:hypothetical protein
MAQNFQIANSHLSHSRTISLTFIAIGLVFLLAVASGLAYSWHDIHAQKSSQQTDNNYNDVSKQNPAPISSDNALHAQQEKVDTVPADDQNGAGTGSATAPGVHDSSTSSATVTVNGKTSTVSGSGSINKSYTSPDGHANVHISINNNSTSKRD